MGSMTVIRPQISGADEEASVDYHDQLPVTGRVDEVNEETDVTTLIAATKLDDLTAPDDNTDLDASTSLHGLMAKADKRFVTVTTDPQGSKTGAQSITPDLTNCRIYVLEIEAGDATLELTVNTPTNAQTNDYFILYGTNLGLCSTSPVLFGLFAGGAVSWSSDTPDIIVLRKYSSGWAEAGEALAVLS